MELELGVRTMGNEGTYSLLEVFIKKMRMYLSASAFFKVNYCLSFIVGL